MDTHQMLSHSLSELYEQFGISRREHAIAQLSLNSAAKVFLAIHAEAHWFDQLKIAEGFIKRQEDAIAFSLHELRKKGRLLERKRIYLEQRTTELNAEADPLKQQLITLTIGQLQDDIFAIEKSLCSQEDAYRDALQEKQIAERERERLMAEHAAEISQGFEHLQSIYSEQALIAAQVRQIESYILAQQTNLPHEVMDILVALPPEKRAAVWWQALEQANQAAVELGFLAVPSSADQLAIVEEK